MPIPPPILVTSSMQITLVPCPPLWGQLVPTLLHARRTKDLCKWHAGLCLTPTGREQHQPPPHTKSRTFYTPTTRQVSASHTLCTRLHLARPLAAFWADAKEASHGPVYTCPPARARSPPIGISTAPSDSTAGGSKSLMSETWGRAGSPSPCPRSGNPSAHRWVRPQVQTGRAGAEQAPESGSGEAGASVVGVKGLLAPGHHQGWGGGRPTEAWRGCPDVWGGQAGFCGSIAVLQGA